MKERKLKVKTKSKQILIQQLSGFSKQKGDTVILSGKQLKENGFELMFSWTDTLKGHKDEK